jgi:hypothetical protein
MKAWVAIVAALTNLAGEGVAAAQTAPVVFEKVGPFRRRDPDPRALITLGGHARRARRWGTTPRLRLRAARRYAPISPSQFLRQRARSPGNRRGSRGSLLERRAARSSSNQASAPAVIPPP